MAGRARGTEGAAGKARVGGDEEARDVRKDDRVYVTERK